MKTKTVKSEKIAVLRDKRLSTHPFNLPNMAEDGTARIVVIVAEKLVYEVGREQKSFKMEAGRVAAQAAHAVSKLKLQYICDHETETDSASSLAYQLIATPITTIVLGARDNKEVAHIHELVGRANILNVAFYDDNEQVYGTPSNILTAVAIGPIHKNALTGISDYLPLYKAAGEA